MKYLKIGEMAQLNHISIQTLRYYDQINLLKPIHIDPESNYRYYALTQSADLDLIIFLKNLDFTLEDIKTILDMPHQVEYIKAIIIEKTKELQKEKKEIDLKLQTIKQFKHSFNYFIQNEHFSDVKFEYIPTRFIETFDTNKNIYQMNMDEYEQSLRDFKQSLSQENQYFHKVGSIMKQDDFMNKNYFSNELILFYDKQNKHKKRKEIPGTYYAVSFCHLFENELAAIDALHTYLISEGINITGDYICEVIHELPYEKEGQRNMFIRLQVPILHIP